MRIWITTLSVMLTTLLGMQAALAGEGIVAVLERSQAARLENMAPVDPAGARAMVVRASLETLVHALRLIHPVELRLVGGEVVAETLQGRVVVVNESLAELTEGERLFILAHELGHIELRHWEQTERLYQKWLPGAVTPEQTNPVAALLGRDASGLAHQQEYEADAYAAQALRRLGLPLSNAVSALSRLGMMQETATHPETKRRLAFLRTAEANRLLAGDAETAQGTTWNEPMVSVKRPD